MGTVLVLTGASKGIGAAIAEIFLSLDQENMLVAVARSEPPLTSLLERYGKDRVGVVAGDITDRIVSEQAISVAKQKFGRVDAVIANAGVLDPVEHINETDVEKWRTLYDINLFSVVELAKESIPELNKTKGRFIAVSSGASVKPYDAWGAYGSSKAALNHFISSLNAEEKNISAISVAPGVVATNMQKDIREEFGKKMSPESLQRFVDLHKNGQLLSPEVPAAVYVDLAVKGWKDELDGTYVRFDDEQLQK